MIHLGILFLVAASVAPAQAADAQAPVTCEFRVFDGSTDITRDTRVVVYASGTRENGVRLDRAGRTRLASGLYDVQAIRQRDGQVVGIRWLEHLLIAHYPDEEGFHLEVINFDAKYGALELKPPEGTEYDAAAFPLRDHTRAVAAALPGAGYLLLVVPAGRYDVRVRAKGAKAVETWLPEMEVPAGRTRLRTIRPPDEPTAGGR